ncbi:MAG TPA: hypothetical protein DEP20_00340 [Fusobacteria bacterium]|nr:hypothetical protein [Fusobacteriota bacterium]|tara:strand:- start:3122 stop:3469 length:348 start_codon:yes stop_codon:yes gene_type:complete
MALIFALIVSCYSDITKRSKDQIESSQNYSELLEIKDTSSEEIIKSGRENLLKFIDDASKVINKYADSEEEDTKNLLKIIKKKIKSLKATDESYLQKRDEGSTEKEAKRYFKLDV